MTELKIIPAVFCPWTKQLHDVELCNELCDHYGGINNDQMMICNYKSGDNCDEDN